MDLVCIKALGYLALPCRQPCLSPVDVRGQGKVRQWPLRPVFSGYVRIQGRRSGDSLFGQFPNVESNFIFKRRQLFLHGTQHHGEFGKGPLYWIP